MTIELQYVYANTFRDFLNSELGKYLSNNNISCLISAKDDMLTIMDVWGDRMLTLYPDDYLCIDDDGKMEMWTR